MVEKSFVIFVPFVVNDSSSFPTDLLIEKIAPVAGDFVFQFPAAPLTLGNFSRHSYGRVASITAQLWLLLAWKFFTSNIFRILREVTPF